MRFPTAPATTNTVSLDEIISRIGRQDVIDGIVFMGSTGTDELTPTSDYDVLLIFRELPVPLQIVTTWIDGRLTELYCTTTAALVRAAGTPERWAPGSEEEALLRWLRSGRIEFDRCATLQQIQDGLEGLPSAVPSDATIAFAWWGIGYNLAQLERYLASSDPVAESVVHIRLLYSVFQVVAHYFTVRKLAWPGEKVAVEYLTVHDPEYLDMLRRCLEECDLNRKAGLYRRLAELTLEPVGDLWREGTTTVTIGPGFGTGADLSSSRDVVTAVETGLNYWHSLVNDEPN